MKSKFMRNATGKLFLLPAGLVVFFLLIYPVLSSIFYSFTSKHLIKQKYRFVAFDNYIRLFEDPEFFHAMLTSINWTLFSLSGQLIVGFTAALALHRIPKGKGIYRTLLIIPWAFPSIVTALSWKWILNGVYGYVPNMLVTLGLADENVQFLADPNLVFPTLVFVNIWFGAPLIMVNVLSALQTVPTDQYDAAKIDAATPWQSFIYITLPHIRVVIGLLVVLRTIWVFNNFDTIYLITGGGPANATLTLPIYAYNVGWGVKQLGVASAVTIILVIFLIIVSAFYFKVLDRWEKQAEA